MHGNAGICISKITFIQYYRQLRARNITASVVLLYWSLFYTFDDVLCIAINLLWLILKYFVSIVS